MALYVVYGQRRSNNASDLLVSKLEELGESGTLYLGYPSFPLPDGTLTVDALLLNEAHGVVVFDFSDPDADREGSENRKSDTKSLLSTRLSSSRALRNKDATGIAIPINYVRLAAIAQPGKGSSDSDLCTLEGVLDRLATFAPITSEQLQQTSSAIEFVGTIKPSKRRQAKVQRSRGWIMNQIEAEVANLDKDQKWAAIELPDSPQRIRGLAGSGKNDCPSVESRVYACAESRLEYRGNVLDAIAVSAIPRAPAPLYL